MIKWPFFSIVLQSPVDNGILSILLEAEIERFLKDNKVKQDLVLDLE